MRVSFLKSAQKHSVASSWPLPYGGTWVRCESWTVLEWVLQSHG